MTAYFTQPQPSAIQAVTAVTAVTTLISFTFSKRGR